MNWSSHTQSGTPTRRLRPEECASTLKPAKGRKKQLRRKRAQSRRNCRSERVRERESESVLYIISYPESMQFDISSGAICNISHLHIPYPFPSYPSFPVMFEIRLVWFSFMGFFDIDWLITFLYRLFVPSCTLQYQYLFPSLFIPLDLFSQDWNITRPSWLVGWLAGWLLAIYWLVSPATTLAQLQVHTSIRPFCLISNDPFFFLSYGSLVLVSSSSYCSSASFFFMQALSVDWILL